jgi:pimeloyl-ACP methyl ester carboxylesterase
MIAPQRRGLQVSLSLRARAAGAAFAVTLIAVAFAATLAAVAATAAATAAVAGPKAATQPGGETPSDRAPRKPSREIVLIHGLGSNAAVWDRVVPYLMGTAQVATYELHGHGETQPMPDPTIDKEAVALGEFLRDNGIEYPTLVGHAMGGMIAMRYTVDHPAAVHRLIVIDAAPRQLASFEEKMQVANALVDDYERFVAARYLAYSDDEEISREIVDAALRTDVGSFVSLVMSSFDFDLTEPISRLSVPILVIGSDLLFPEDKDPRVVLVQIGFGPAQNVAFRRIAGAGHYVMLEQPVTTAAAILAFAATRQFD